MVALPLALAFGNAALGPGGAIYGLYGAIVAGFLAALFGGTPAQVSGPTGPMSVTVAGVVSSLAAAGVSRDLSAGEMLPLVMAVVLGGVEALLGALRLGRHHACSHSVVSGFMSGIGAIILVLQPFHRGEYPRRSRGISRQPAVGSDAEPRRCRGRADDTGRGVSHAGTDQGLIPSPLLPCLW